MYSQVYGMCASLYAIAVAIEIVSIRFGAYIVSFSGLFSSASRFLALAFFCCCQYKLVCVLAI